MRETLLLFGAGEILPQVRRALLPLKVYVRTVPVEDYTRPIGEIAGGEKGGEGAAPYDGPDFPEPMAVLAGFFGARLDNTLLALRRAGVRIDRKAVLTAANRQWTALALYEELGREHEAMRSHLRAHQPKGPEKSS